MTSYIALLDYGSVRTEIICIADCMLNNQSCDKCRTEILFECCVDG
jgi:hypothetical protein